MAGDTCEKHDGCMQNMREDLHEQDKLITRLEGRVGGFIDAAKEYIEASRKDIYGKGGLMDRVGNHAAQLILQWGLLIIILVAVVTKVIRG